AFAAEDRTVGERLQFVGKVRHQPDGAGVKLDLVRSGLSALGLALTVFGILKISSWGFLRPTGALTVGGTEITPFGLSVVPFLLLAGLVVLGVFTRWELRVEGKGRTPLLRADLLRIPQMRAGLSTVLSQYL